MSLEHFEISFNDHVGDHVWVEWNSMEGWRMMIPKINRGNYFKVIDINDVKQKLYEWGFDYKNSPLIAAAQLAFLNIE